MNVLVYNGPGVSQTSLSSTLSSLRVLLSSNYTIQTISPKSLTSEPWTSNCALLVIPGGRDLPYVSSLKAANDHITTYVKNGGAFLGLCAGAYYACRRVEWETGTEKEVSGDRPLRFFNNVCRGCVYSGFEYESESGAKAVTLSIEEKGEQVSGIYYNGGGEFIDAENTPGARVLARYTEDDGKDKVAGVACKVGLGIAVLWSVHPEYSLTLEPALSAITRTRPELLNQLPQLEEHRWSLMRETLQILGLHTTTVDPQKLEPKPQLLTSTSQSSSLIDDVMKEIKNAYSDAVPIVIKDNTDTFHLYSGANVPDSVGSQSPLNHGDAAQSEDRTAREIIVFTDGIVPPRNSTPSFNIARYFSSLCEYQGEQERQDPRIGEILLYSEVVTSTQSLLDKNHKILSYLPSPLLSLATHQIAGRGRGTNQWVSPRGCLQFSLRLRIPLSSFPTSKLVFIQYLFGLAVVEACRTDRVIGKFGEKVRLKWPNDIYAINNGNLRKIGGILVNTSFTGGMVDIVIGCGLNVLSPSPITSLCHLVPVGLDADKLSMEDTAATIMTIFQDMWAKFACNNGSFEPFIDLYLERWLHTDQVVQLTTVDPHMLVRIVGITLDHGLLRTMPESNDYRSIQGGNFIDLQPDGNSFDIMGGLIKSKT